MLWTVKETANYLNISISMVYKLVSLNKIPCVRLGDCVRFNQETVEALTKESRNESSQLPAPIDK
jgi:excisionase family DNA binding protein